jgi:hypothetical protein
MPRHTSENSAQVFLAAFGKHPGWDDHIDDPGLETEALIATKRAVYAEGVGRNVDAGAWDSLDEGRRVDRFHHLLVNRIGPDFVLGRMWSSSDGKGRTRYPMIVAAHFHGAALDWALGEALPRLEKLEGQCTSATAAAEVRAALDSARATLRAALSEAGAGALDTGHRINPVVKLLEHPALRAVAGDAAGQPPVSRGEPTSDLPLGLLRILYQIEREMASFRRVNSSSTTTMRLKSGPARAQQIRVPRCAQSPADAVLLWMSFLSTQLHEAAPVMLMIPLEHDWADIIVGEPTATQLFCMRANRQALPLVTEIPFSLEPEFRQRAREFIEDAKAGEGLSLAVAGARPGRRGDKPRGGGLLRRLVSVVPGFRSAGT